MSDACVCIHAHFYQPPRENPWLEEVECQPSADPFHDWNERITAECYRPNAAARLLDDDGRIVGIRDNYERISFNFGPTLLNWMERQEPVTYRAILDADRRSRDRFAGHGSALAQPYHHTILPLASDRDRRTEIAWGVADFRHRFGRDPEGMWLPETAVSVATLEALAEHDIRFTVLAPHQAARTRALDGESWIDSEGGPDTRVPYIQRLPSGRQIALFFYDGSTSTAVAFENLLEDGMLLADRLSTTVRDGHGPRLAHIATDGETYGHHHAHGEMALAEALRRWEVDPALRLTNYGAFLAAYPPWHEVEIREDTSWSCAHGVERWRSDCGCASGGYPDWNQAWRGPLRAGLDAFASDLAAVFERRTDGLLRDPWAARDDYVNVLLVPGREARREFLARHAQRELRDAEAVLVFRLLELQRHALLMFTSCGWFFDDLAGIETRQILEYAGRALELAESVGEISVRGPLLEALSAARANGPDAPDGRRLIELASDAARVTPTDLATTHVALETVGASLTSTGAWRLTGRSASVATPGTRAVAGVVEVSSRRTGESQTYEFRGMSDGQSLRVRLGPPGTDFSASEAAGIQDIRSVEQVRLAPEEVRSGLMRLAAEGVGPPTLERLERALWSCAMRPGEPELATRAFEILIEAASPNPPSVTDAGLAALERALETQLERLIRAETGEDRALLATASRLLDVAESWGAPVVTARLQNRWWHVVAGRDDLETHGAADVGRRLGFSDTVLERAATGDAEHGGAV